MAGRNRSGSVDWRVAAQLAEIQHGLVTRPQLRRLGATGAAIDHAIATGRLFPVFRGTFGLGHRPTGREARLLAAVLACGDEAVISHGTAAALIGLWDRPPQSIDITARAGRGRKLPGVHRRHTPLPRDDERWVFDAIPCTTPARTIVDVAGIVGEPALRHTIEQAAVARMLDLSEINTILTQRRRRGSRLLRLVLDDWRRYQPNVRLRSVLEARLFQLVAQHDLESPRCNVELAVGGSRLEVDFLWPRQRLIIEVDGGRYHDNPQALARDRRRDHLLGAAGYRVWRLDWDAIVRGSASTMTELARRLGQDGLD
jgi:very-short-patch-repair endonuclease